MNSFWMVFKVGGGAPHYQHQSQDAAMLEAHRLATQCEGEFLVLEAVGRAQSFRRTEVVLEQVDKCPF